MRDGQQACCQGCAAAHHHDGPAAPCKSRKAMKGRAGHLRRHDGMSEAERNALMKEQRRMCPLCLACPVHVDHDHGTGRVRGVLCFSCNAALGQFKDRPDVLRRAAEYLEGNVWKPIFKAPGVYQLPS
ncbi:endonuclease VII domain-containing protein [Streptomyces lydicus]|uniref:endonuclease VII domain-containing protein n=1 Tax=Streptomyces lydicus TaxID=47763 RepID=UPI0036C6B464